MTARDIAMSSQPAEPLDMKESFGPLLCLERKAQRVHDDPA